MSNLIIEKLLAKSRRTDLPQFGPGDTVRVHVKIKEGDKERVQAFEGVVISRTSGPQASFTVRKISFGQGVERIFPFNSKVIDKVEKIRSYKVRRAKLFYIRGLRGKAARLKEADREQPTAAATTGPNIGPRPTSSHPAMRRKPSLRAARSSLNPHTGALGMHQV